MALAEHFGVTRTESEVERLYRSGKSLSDMLVELCAHQASMDEIWQVAMSEYHNPEFAKRPIEGAIRSVRWLRGLGYRTALFSATSPKALSEDMRATGVDPGEFSGATLHVAEGMRKSDPESFAPVLEWLASYGLSAREALYVGDGLGDMEGSTGAGLRFVGVEQGFITAEEFREAGALSVASVQKLATIAINLSAR